MKKFMISFIGLSLSVSSAFAVAIPQQMTCQNNNGGKIVVTLQPTEGVNPEYSVQLYERNRLYKSFYARLANNTSSQFRIEADDDERANTIVSVGYSYSMSQAFMQYVANGGLSPLPAMFYNKCSFK